MNVYRYKDPQGSSHLAVLTKAGHKWLHLVMLDFPVRLKKVRKSEQRYMDEMNEDLKRTCEAMLDAGTRMGITKAAEDALKATLASYTDTRGE